MCEVRRAHETLHVSRIPEAIFLILTGSFPVASSTSAPKLLSVTALRSGGWGGGGVEGWGAGVTCEMHKARAGEALCCVCQAKK